MPAARIAALAVALFFVPALAVAQVPAASPPTTFAFTASGEAKAEPDMASFTVGAQTIAPTAAKAMAANAERMTAVIAALKRAGIAPRDLATARISVTPQLVYDAGRPPRLTGYEAVNEAAVTVRDLASLGRTLDAATDAGATTIGDVVLGFANPVAVENVARFAATKAVEDKAALYGQATGYHIVRLLSLSEGVAGESEPRPITMAAMQPRAKLATPVEPGAATVRIEIAAVFEMAR